MSYPRHTLERRPERPGILTAGILLTGFYASQPAENLSAAINTPSTEADPYIAPDESYLIFISTRRGGHGSGDLYISRRDGDGWSAPENMGPSVNGDDSDYTPFVSGDGETLYFARGWGEMWMTPFAPWRR